MPSPFPGVDPYLENRHFWSGFPKMYISMLTAELNAFLPKPFVAAQEERVYLVPSDHYYFPDSLVVLTDSVTEDSRSKVMTLPVQADAPVIIETEEEEVTEPYIEILIGEPPQQVVTVIELLSPKNKYAAGKGREEYRKKQKKMLRSDVNFLEMDFLRGGSHTVALERERLAPYEPFDYLVSLHRAAAHRFEAWPFSLKTRIPRVRIPLTEEAGDLHFDLQVPFNKSYEGGGYSLRLFYGGEPTPRLPSEQRAWAHEILQKAGLRK